MKNARGERSRPSSRTTALTSFRLKKLDPFGEKFNCLTHYHRFPGVNWKHKLYVHCAPNTNKTRSLLLVALGNPPLRFNMLSLGALIWVSVRPLLRLVLCTGFGVLITRADIFPAVASRGAGQIILNITIPCLMFSKIVPAFSQNNIGTLGPLFLVAFIYEGMGLLLAWIVKQFFWVPHRFRYGILVAGGWGNYGDIPTSVVMSITAGPPFNSTNDQTLAVAYISAFIFVFFLTLFPFGGSRMIAWDFAGPEVEDEEMREVIRLKRRTVLQIWKKMSSISRRRLNVQALEEDDRYSDETEGKQLPYRTVLSGTQFDEECPLPNTAPGPLSTTSGNHKDSTGTPEDTTPIITVLPSETIVTTSRISYTAHVDTSVPHITSPAPTITHVDTVTQVEPHALRTDNTHAKPVRFDEASSSGPVTDKPTFWKRTFKRARIFLVSLSSPPSLSIIVAFPVALITPLKGLFVTLPNSPIPNAPDGQPPLAFIMDTANFIGAASVPLGLICLGAALARLKVPMSLTAWKAMPVGSISALAIAKIVVSPILGVIICQGLTSAGVIDKNDKVLRFVCIFFSCLPTATTQVYLTQVYSSTGSAEHISAFLIPQYALMVIMMTVLTAYSINLIF